MGITIDGQAVFDEQPLEIEAGSFSRSSIEKAVPGLDGILTIDLGRRGRKVKQTGTLRAKSRVQMDERIAAISAYMDGRMHTLVTGDERGYQNLRMDSFTVTGERVDGAFIVIDYEITYMQLT
jgi:hypothetical protein